MNEITKMKCNKVQYVQKTTRCRQRESPLQQYLHVAFAKSTEARGIAYLCATSSLKWLVSVQIVCVCRAAPFHYAMSRRLAFKETFNYVFEPIDRRSGFRRSKKKKKKKKKAGRDVLVNEDMIGQ